MVTIPLTLNSSAITNGKYMISINSDSSDIGLCLKEILLNICANMTQNNIANNVESVKMRIILKAW